MEQLGKHAINHGISKGMNGIKNTFKHHTGGSQKKIAWDNYNFPPCLNLIHYDLNEIDEPEKTVVRRLYMSYMLFFIWGVFNLITTVLVVTSGTFEGIRIFYSVFSFILF